MLQRKKITSLLNEWNNLPLYCCHNWDGYQGLGLATSSSIEIVIDKIERFLRPSQSCTRGDRPSRPTLATALGLGFETN